MQYVITVVIYFIIGFFWAYISHRKDWYFDITPMEYLIFFLWPLVGIIWLVIYGIVRLTLKFDEGIQLLFTTNDSANERIRMAHREKLTPKVNYQYEEFD